MFLPMLAVCGIFLGGMVEASSECQLVKPFSVCSALLPKCVLQLSLFIFMVFFKKSFGVVFFWCFWPIAHIQMCRPSYKQQQQHFIVLSETTIRVTLARDHGMNSSPLALLYAWLWIVPWSPLATCTVRYQGRLKHPPIGTAEITLLIPGTSFTWASSETGFSMPRALWTEKRNLQSVIMLTWQLT